MDSPLKAAPAFPADDLPGKRVAVLIFIPLRHALFFPPLPDDRGNRLKSLPAHNRRVVAFHVVHILFAPVCMPVKLAVRVGLLEQDVPGIFLIFQNPANCGGSPPSILFRGNTFFIQRRGDPVASFARQRLREHPAHNLRLFLVDDHVPIDVFISVWGIGNLKSAILEPPLRRPLVIFRNGYGLALRKAAQNGKHQLTFHFAGIQVFFLKIDVNSQVYQLSDQFQAVHRVSGKPADGLRDNEIDLPILTVRDQTEQLCALLFFRPCDAFVIVQPAKLPIGIPFDIGLIVHLLHFQADKLFLRPGGHPAVCRHTEFPLSWQIRPALFNFCDPFHLLTSLFSGHIFALNPHIIKSFWA